MAAVERDASPALRTYVRRYYGFEELARGPVLRREGPGVDVLLLFSFGFGWRIGDATDPSRPWARHESFVAGLHESAVLTEHDGRSYGMQVSLTPPGAFALLAAPLHELAGRTLDADAVLGPDAHRLAEQLAEAPGWSRRFDLLDSALARRLTDDRRPSQGVVSAWRRLTATHGQVRIDDVARETGWSRKRLAARFREEVGLPPKTIARLLRFERAKASLESSEGPDLARLAVECGYYDQAHLTKEFRRISGTTPAAYAASPGTDFQDTGRPRS